MSPKKPVSPVDLELDQRRSETLQLLDRMFPEISKTLPKNDIQAALLAVEAEQVRLHGADPNRLRSMIEHVFIAGHLWAQHWEQLLVSAVRHRLGSSLVTDKQVFIAASEVTPPRPAGKSDGGYWLGFADAVAQQVQSHLVPSGSGAQGPGPSTRETSEWQDAFAADFVQRLRSHLGKVD